MMNNKFSDFVKKSNSLTLLKLIGFFFLSIGVPLVSILTKLYFVIPLCLVLFIIVVSIRTNKEREQIKKYKLGADYDNGIFIPLVLDNEYLNKLSKEIKTTIEIPKNIKSLVNYVQYMIDDNLMIFVENNFKLDDLVSLLNNLMKNNNINYQIDKNDIIKNDDEIIKLRRQDNIINDFHDLSVIRSILESNQLELIRFFAPNDGFSKLSRIEGYIITVVPITKVETLKKYQIELMNNLKYKYK